MNGSKFVKLLGLVAGIVCLNVVVLSPGLLGVRIGGSAFETAFGVTVLFVSFLVLLYGSYTLLFKPPVAMPVKDRMTYEDYIAALRHYRNTKGLKKEVSLALDQLERMQKKKDALSDVLAQRFDEAELSYKKFQAVIHDVEKLMYRNIGSILNKLGAFGASDFAGLAQAQQKSRVSARLLEEKKALYNEYLAYVTGYLGVNEEILLKLDKLLLEISLLGSADYRDVDDMPCMQEIDLLIKQTKLYKQ